MTFSWKFRNLNIANGDYERHFVCSTTKARKCLTYTASMKFKKATYALHGLEQYQFKNEEDLSKALSKQKN